MDSNKCKRERCKNFLEEEREYLLELIQQKKSVLENKKTDAVSCTRKNEVWASVARQFNASAKTGTRTVAQLKLLYENLKRTTKKKIADEKLETYKTGGGVKASGISDNFSVCEQLISDILGPSVAPLENPFDSNVSLPVPTSSVSRYNISDNEEENVENGSIIFTAEGTSGGEVAADEDLISVAISPTAQSTPVIEKIKNIRKRKRKCEHNDNDEVNKKVLKMKLERHEKKMEILDIIKQKELLELKEKKLDIAIKEATLARLQ